MRRAEHRLASVLASVDRAHRASIARLGVDTGGATADDVAFFFTLRNRGIRMIDARGMAQKIRPLTVRGWVESPEDYSAPRRYRLTDAGRSFLVHPATAEV